MKKELAKALEGCADRWEQWEYPKKRWTSTVTTKSVLIGAAIEAKENSDLAVACAGGFPRCQ